MSNCKIKIAKIVKIDINRMWVRKKKFYQLLINLLDAFLKTRSVKAEMEVSKELRSKTSRITQNPTACIVRKNKTMHSVFFSASQLWRRNVTIVTRLSVTIIYSFFLF